MNTSTRVRSSNGDFAKAGSAFFDLNKWFLILVSELKPDFVIGIARSAIRILQLTNSNEIVINKLLSQNALPFISDKDIKGKVILLFDDSIIYGSTLSKIRDYLIQRGAVVHCASYIIDKEVFYGERKSQIVNPSPFSKISIDYKYKLSSLDVKKHHYSLIKSVIRSSMDYNLDFPTFRIKLSEYEPCDIPFLINLIKKSLPCANKVYDVTTPLSSEKGIYRYTILLNNVERKIYLTDKIQFLFGSKLRITFDSNNSEIRLKFLPQFAIRDGLLFEEVSFFESQILEYWKKFSTPDINDIYYNQSLHRLITVFGATIYSYFILKILCNSLIKEFSIISSEMDHEDIAINMGHENSSILELFWKDLPKLELKLENLDIQQPIEIKPDKDLIDKIERSWKKNPSLIPESGEKAYESLSKILMAVNLVTDDEERRNQNSSADRMEVGLTVGDIRNILEKKFVSHNPDNISTALDVCVDYGQAVPKVIHRGDFWVRASYSGETKDAQNLIQMRDELHKAYTNFLAQKNSKPFNRFDIQKLCTSMKEVIKWLPISSNFGTYGRVASIERTPDNQGLQNIVDWLQFGLHPAFKEQFIKDKKVKVFYPENTYKQQLVYPVWSKEELLEFHDAFDYLSAAFQVRKYRSDNDAVKLLLSTCRNHEHTFEAVITEAYSWIYDKKTKGFDNLLGEILQATNKNIFKEYAIEKIYWCITFLNEAHKKRHLFNHQFSETQNLLRDALIAQGGGGKRFWEYRVEPLLDPNHDPDIDVFFSILNPLIVLMELLTLIIIRSMIEFKICSLDELKTELEEKGMKVSKIKWLNLRDDISSLAFKYNVAIKDRNINKAIVKRKFTPSDYNQKNNLLDACNQCYMEIKDAMSCSFYPYESVEGGFCFVPKSKVQVRKDGREVRRLRGMYVLTTDIIGSKGSSETEKMNDIILNYLKKYNEIYYEETGDDSYIICSTDPKTLWYIAKDLSIHATKIKTNESDFRGIRKALFRGDVAIISDNKSTVVRDIQRLDTLPQAVYLLEAYKEKNKLATINKDEHNSIIVIETKTAKDLIHVLNLSYKDEDEIPLFTKHFNGSFVFFLQNLERNDYE